MRLRHRQGDGSRRAIRAPQWQGAAAFEADPEHQFVDRTVPSRRVAKTRLQEHIAERHPLAISIMPEGLPDAMTAQEFRDLLAFLMAVEEK